jgi:hypothetical protein
MTPSELRIAQDSRQEGKAWWRWSAWIEGKPEALDAVEEVVWHLHPTFPQPTVRSRDRTAKFLLTTSGWGEFLLRATVVIRDGGRIHLDHSLELASEDGEAGTRGAAEEVADPVAVPAPRVYLSYSLADADAARAVQNSLERHGLLVELPNEDTAAGESLGDTVRRSIAESDGVVVLHSTAASEFVALESKLASDQEKLVFDVLFGDVTAPPSPTSERQRRVHLDRKDLGGVDELARQVVESLRRRS